MSERRVEIKSFSDGQVLYTVPSRNVRRVFSPNMKMKVPYEELEEGLCDYGVRELFLTGLLACVDTKDAVDLELMEAPKIETLKTNKDVYEILSSKDNSAIYLFMKNATAEQRETIIDCIVQNEMYDSNLVKWCKEFFDVNVLNIITKRGE